MLTICPDPRCNTSSALRTELQEPTLLLQVPNIFQNLQDTKAMMEIFGPNLSGIPKITDGYLWIPMGHT
jgi:hypothetical protein